MHLKGLGSQYMCMTLKNTKNQKNNNLSPYNLLSKNRMMMTHSSIMVRNQKKLILDVKKEKLNPFKNLTIKNNKKNPKSNPHKNNLPKPLNHKPFNTWTMLLIFQKPSLSFKIKFLTLNFTRKTLS